MQTRVRTVAEAMVALGPERAATLLQSLDEEQLLAVTAEIQQVGVLDPERAEEALRELATGLGEPQKASGGQAFARDVLSRIVGDERVDEVLDLANPQRSAFGFIAAGEPELIARVLGAEPPGVAALALSSLDSRRAAQLLKLLPAEQQADLAMRIATIAAVPQDIFDLVEIDLRDRIAPMTADVGLHSVEGLDVLVAILGESNRKTEKRVVESIREQDEDLATRIREALFSFEDIAVLDNRAIQEVLKSVDSADLAFALKSAAEAIQERFMSNLSERARSNLIEEMDYLQSVAASDMRAAQKRIVATVRELEESGAIVIERSGGDDDDDEDDDE